MIRIFAGEQELFLVVLRIHPPGQAKLAMARHALHPLSLELALNERRKEKAGENGNNGYDNEQFDQRERAGRDARTSPIASCGSL